MAIPCWYVAPDRSNVVRQTIEASRFGRVFCGTATTETRTLLDKQGNEIPVQFTKDEVGT